ncbi:MAG TPA: FAD-binding oxidoreductase [Ramlibacter sp.]|uniref:NAD(P)/FAD-dependent oxidoreductase n=1 Tax=Ramlibacter sp. TaxID=1917967 RepID=UPI002BE92DCA|nr:FAD-binding oxidoreductase [Ramlibacter sp.]HVZ44473.1 FAD-binding oxidoreductase [Ramlibacter sp.]
MSLPAQRSLWEATAIPAPALQGPLGGARETEVLIVGAGFAGLSTALELALRGVAVTVLEAGRVGEGASGRNGGQVLHGGRHALDELVLRFGWSAAQRLHRFAFGAVEAAFALIDRHQLRCDARRAGSIYAADTDEGVAQVREKLEALQRSGIAARWLDASALESAIGTRAYRGGYFNPNAGSVHPLSLVRELARAARDAGARIHEQTRALSMQRHGSSWRITTQDGRVDARRVLIATNGSAAPLVPALERSLLRVWSFQVATEPVPFAGEALAQGTTVSDTRRLLRYFRQDAQGRLLVGGKGTVRAPAGLPSFALQERTLRSLWPHHRETPLGYWWGGEVSVTLGRFPKLYSLGEDAWASVACNGKGVAWNLALGAVLADLLEGVSPEALPLPPPEPLRPLPLFPLRRYAAAAGALWLRTLDGLASVRSLS